MKIIKKPVDFVVKQLQSKRYHVKKQDNKKAYDRERAKKEFRKNATANSTCFGDARI